MTEDGPVAKLDAELKKLLPNDLVSEKMSKKSRLTWPFKEKEMREMADRLKQYYVDITAILAIDSWNTIREISQGAQDLREDSTAQKYAKKRNPETGGWIFQNDQFATWNNSDHTFLWLNGQAGHGKTILASAVVDNIRGNAESQTLGYFYCNFRDDRTANAAAVLRSLIVQLLQQSEVDWITKIKQMKADICAHTTEQLKNQKRLSRLPHALKKTILEKLLEKAEGIPELFAFAGRHIHSVDLDQLNEVMMIEVGQSNLNPDLGVIDPMDIVVACTSLVTYNEKTGVVNLSHYSVKV
ncbi:hypothetical protein BDR04DRAFT_1143813 [Suillus decipiens]|nr:hypothetical protein BDR04DRAFT_1143813 [Suillus decipiens]